MTSYAAECEEQRPWAARLHHPNSIYDKLLDNEFQQPEESQARIAKALSTVLRFASTSVPHYRDLFARSGFDVWRDEPLARLAELPVLTKLDVHDAGTALQAESLPPGGMRANWTYSSGTTGRPTGILHSMLSTRMFSWLKQREYRWFRLDPSKTLAAMRLPSNLPRRDDGSELKSGDTARLDAWPYFNNFRTGPYIGISIMTPVEKRIAWLRRECPDYLIALPGTLELLAFATGAERPAESLKAIHAISEELPSGMRALIARSFGVPVHQNYGLNEIGLVAARCEAGRYHVHTEHCLVEILDDQGLPAKPGQTGRIFVTGLTNFAMPLIRYDTGDSAQATEDPCPCNRTLPSFGDIAGRSTRVAHLPAGTTGRVMALREAIEGMPLELMQGFREFQIHQHRDHRMELRYVTRAPLPDGFFERLRSVWAKASGGDGPDLVVNRVEKIPQSPGGKFEVFSSDFIPARDWRPPAATEAGDIGGD